MSLPSKWRAAGFFCLVLLVDAVVAVALAEFWVRLFVPVRNPCYAVDADIGLQYCPRQNTVGYIEGDYVSRLVTNGDGFHDREWEPSREQGFVDVQVYGDSLVAGENLAIKETIPALLQESLNRRLGKDAVRARNFGQPGTGTAAQLATYRKFGRRFRGDVVVLFFDGDFLDNVPELAQEKYQPFVELKKDGTMAWLPTPQKVTSSGLVMELKKNFLLYAHVRDKLQSSKAYNGAMRLVSDWRDRSARKGPGEVQGGLEKNREALLAESMEVSCRLLGEFAAEVERSGGEFVVVEGVETPSTAKGVVPDGFIARCLRARGVKYLDYVEFVRRVNSGAARFKDGHPKASGNRLIAERLSEELMQVVDSRQEPQRERPSGATGGVRGDAAAGSLQGGGPT